MKTTKKKVRRSDHKIMTKEASVLKYLRESRKLSIRKAAKVIGISDTKLNHAENGRCDLNPNLILKVLNGLGYSYEEFMALVNKSVPLPENTYAECVEILKRLDKEKLKTIKAILESF
ncbi:DNA-binding helix-turn-helix protein [Bacteriovorax sp. BAL6_X]|uniref:helix-turn-helix domain-containing protein n=1 Tax=Bacteriovorax sp. BAL6_X TaxID=1201290 RepID=UPI0003867FDB|nr:helix-turn-helix transcriptional regulator [Bacteriovorax sp. BAL6_X]EPZ52545.1 DNA-binding helix-turn-helix protein [Bacteriovorax sp. BAL6_X]